MPPSIRLLDHALAILESFESAVGELGTTEISQRLGLPLSTVHRLVTALTLRGYLEQDTHSRRYRLGRQAVLLGARALAGLGIREVAHPFLEQFVTTTGETAQLGILQEAEVLLLDKVIGPQPVQVNSVIGTRAPAALTAMGKAILAYRGPEETERALASLLPTGGYGGYGLVPERQALDAELARIRRTELCVSHGQWYPDVTAVAAPIFNQARSVVAALGTAVPAARLDAAARALLEREVSRTAGAVSARLGFLP